MCELSASLAVLGETRTSFPGDCTVGRSRVIETHQRGLTSDHKPERARVRFGSPSTSKPDASVFRLIKRDTPGATFSGQGI